MSGLLFSLLAGLPEAGPEAAQEITLSPPGSRAEFRAYGFGWLPLDGIFTRFQGWLRYDPANPEICQVMFDIEAASLAMSNSPVMSDESLRNEITGSAFMDVARFPRLVFHGTCRGDMMAGDLLLHGESHPFRLELGRSAQTITATGDLRRADWGMAGRPFSVGPTIRIRVQVPIPGNGRPT